MLIKIRKHITPFNIFVFSILIIALTLRVWRIPELLAFHYDQGRDALVIWDLINNGKLFLIGPTTGIAGVFRGPFYYYLIAPFYFLGQGNPVFPSLFLSTLSVIALYIMYKISFEIGGKTSAVISLILGTFSFEMIYASRWLSNPTPMLFLSMLLIWSILRIYNGNKKYWILVALTLGLSQFSFGSSGEIFYFPAILIFLLFNKRSFPDKNTFIKSVLAFCITFLPLVLFNLRHGTLLSDNIEAFSQNAFGISTAKFTYDRLIQVINYFGSLIFHAPYEKEFLWLITLLVTSLYFLSKLLINPKFKILFIFLISPIIGLLFFKGNFGNIYGYYLTGYFMIFIIFLGTVLGKVFTDTFPGKIFTILFLLVFLNHNWFWAKGMLNTQIADRAIITLGNQKLAIDWIYRDAGEEKFNIDVYVPPVIPHSYNYLVAWKSNPNNVTEQVPLLYTLYEADPDHPERLNAWLQRQKGIGEVKSDESFGGITVQRRERIK